MRPVVSAREGHVMACGVYCRGRAWSGGGGGWVGLVGLVGGRVWWVWWVGGSGRSGGWAGLVGLVGGPIWSGRAYRVWHVLEQCDGDTEDRVKGDESGGG